MPPLVHYGNLHGEYDFTQDIVVRYGENIGTRSGVAISFPVWAGYAIKLKLLVFDKLNPC